MSLLRRVTTIWAMALLCCAAACNSVAPSPTPSTSLWGTIYTFGQAEQTDAPALWPEAAGVRLTWISADTSGIHQEIRALTSSGLSQPIFLPLPAVHPYAQQIAPALGENLHLFWLDANPQNETRLYGAEITSAFDVERGPTLLSEQSAQRYIVIPAGNGAVWLVSSGGLVSEPGLYIRDLDSQGRARLADNYQLVDDADWPAFARRNDGTIDLFWIADSDGKVFRAALANDTLDKPQPITSTVPLNTGDRLENFFAGVDNTRAYLFWNITRADGHAETWLANGLLDTPNWLPPVRLSVDTSLTGSFSTGFNSGTARAAQSGSTALAWAQPLYGQFDNLPVAGLLDKTHLAMLYLKDGQIAGYQDIVAISGLLGAPNLATDRDRHLYLAWAEPVSDYPADLKLTMTRPF